MVTREVLGGYGDGSWASEPARHPEYAGREGHEAQDPSRRLYRVLGTVLDPIVIKDPEKGRCMALF